MCMTTWKQPSKKGALLCWHRLPSSFGLLECSMMAIALAFESVESSRETRKLQESRNMAPGSLAHSAYLQAPLTERELIFNLASGTVILVYFIFCYSGWIKPRLIQCNVYLQLIKQCSSETLRNADLNSATELHALSSQQVHLCLSPNTWNLHLCLLFTFQVFSQERQQVTGKSNGLCQNISIQASTLLLDLRQVH